MENTVAGSPFVSKPTRRTWARVSTAVTAIFALQMAFAGIAILVGHPALTETLQRIHMGNVGLNALIGVFKLIGVVGLFTTRGRATAVTGFSFLMLGALVGHVSAGDPPAQALGPLVPATLLIVAELTRARAGRGA